MNVKNWIIDEGRKRSSRNISKFIDEKEGRGSWETVKLCTKWSNMTRWKELCDGRIIRRNKKEEWDANKDNCIKGYGDLSLKSEVAEMRREK